MNSSLNRFLYRSISDTLFLTSESPDEFFELLENAFEQHKPGYPQDAALVTDSVRSRRVVNRGQRVCDQFEASLHMRTPDSTYFLHSQSGSRRNRNLRTLRHHRRPRHTGALWKLQMIKKMAHDTERWQAQLEREKKKFEMEAQLFKLCKEREEDVANTAAEKKLKASFKTPEELKKMREYVEQAFQGVRVDDYGVGFTQQHIWGAFDEPAKRFYQPNT